MKAMTYPERDHDSHRFCEILKNTLVCFLVCAAVFTSVNLSPQTFADAAWAACYRWTTLGWQRSLVWSRGASANTAVRRPVALLILFRDASLTVKACWQQSLARWPFGSGHPQGCVLLVVLEPIPLGRELCRPPGTQCEVESVCWDVFELFISLRLFLRGKIATGHGESYQSWPLMMLWLGGRDAPMMCCGLGEQAAIPVLPQSSFL